MDPKIPEFLVYGGFKKRTPISGNLEYRFSLNKVTFWESEGRHGSAGPFWAVEGLFGLL